MATNMPDVGGSQHHASVNYAATFGTITTAGGKVSFASPGGTAFVFAFETGRTQPDPQVDLWDVSWDYSWFDQATEEAAIATYLAGICSSLAGLLGVPQADVEQAVTVQRVWSAAPNVQGSAAPVQYASCTVTEVMPFPPVVAGADAVLASDGGEAVA